MLGHAINGTDELEATAFATMMVVKKRTSSEFVDYVVKNAEAEFGKGHPASSLLAAISLSTDQMRSDKVFMSKDTYETMATAKAFVAHAKIANNLENQSVIKGQTNVTAGFLKAEPVNNPQLGQVGNIETSGRFKVNKFTGPYIGPSYLPGDFGDKSRATAQWLHPDLLKVVARARKIAGIKFEIVPGTGGIRSSALQNKLKKAGKSKATVERHTIGHAIDLVPLNKKGNYDFGDHEGFEKIRTAMQIAAEELDIPIQWGGNWKSIVDKPHYELDRVFYPAEGEGPDRRIKVEPYQISAAFR
jgi:peptidoglycan L-alanyl-D-glutamate endopeptidase CwlK